MKVRAMAVRILTQLSHDKRTLALMIFAPMLVLTLIYFIFQASTTNVSVAVINAPENYVERLEEYNIIPVRTSEPEARRALESGEVTATVNIVSGKSYIEVDGSNSSRAKVAVNGLEMAKVAGTTSRPDLKSEIYYIHGYEELSMFDNFGAVLIGFMIFFFVFLIAGISFLQERTTGTLEKLLSTPIKRWEIVTGYVLGFGVVTVIQSIVISLYVVYVLGVMMVGSLWLVLLITLLTAMMALTLGILLSTAANNEFQMIQFIPIVVIPQVFFSGLFDLSPAWEQVGKVMPLYYVANALKEVMLRGGGFSAIRLELGIMLGLSMIFIIANVLLLKRYRKI